MLSEPSVDLFSTCPASTSVAKDRYVQRVAEVARWSEQSGCKGILVYSDNSLLDPWLLAHIIIQNTTALCPLVAVQPVYMHPYAVAKQITSFAYLYGRRLYLNMVAGGFKNDLDALSDTTPHDKRYARLVEYTTIISRLLTGPAPLTYEGDFHSVDAEIDAALARSTRTGNIYFGLVRGRTRGGEDSGCDRHQVSQSRRCGRTLARRSPASWRPGRHHRPRTRC